MLMELLQRLVALLGRFGFNTTRMKWKLFQLEKRMQKPRMGARLPTSLQWLAYPHKRCRHCNGIVDRSARVCEHCGKRVPSMLWYRISRLIGIAAPKGSPVMLGAFVLIMLINFALMIAMQGMSVLMGPTGVTLNVFGAWSPLLAVVHHEYWRYLAFGIGHIGVIHIGFNLFALAQVGPLVEERIGPWRMLVLITVTQLTAAIASHYYYYNYRSEMMAITAGASGWLFGLIGYGIAHFHRQTGVLKDYQHQLIKWGIYSLIFGYIIGANNAAHVGGMLGGLALGIIPEPRRHSAKLGEAVWRGVAGISALLWIVTLAYLAYSIGNGWTPGGGAR
ncbi:MAG: rhomboid family intramembrane serine protease [Candidatus Hydrogenedentes bacterium]|nr:rhomboid family intramembrane serine protease [Candidatus Hydrogenedentota bacterium]